MALLRAGGSATDAVEIAIKVLEDREITNAGYGSNLAIDGVVECDAVIVNHVEIKNPISLARLLLDRTEQPMSLRRVPPNFLVGQGATDFAYEYGMPVLAIDKLISPNARERWKRWRHDLNKAEDDKRRVQSEKYGAPSTPSETDLTDYLHSNHNFELDRKSHTQAMRAGLFNEGQPMSPPPSSDQRESHDHRSKSLSTASTRSTPELEYATNLQNSYNDNICFGPHVAPGIEPDNFGQTSLLQTSSGSSAELLGGDPGLQMPRGCGSAMWQSSPGRLHQLSTSATCGWRDGSSSSDSGNTAIVLDESVLPQPTDSTQSRSSNGASSLSHRARTERDQHSCKTASPYQDGHSPKDQDLITDTVGAIAVDITGRIACGASSGGIGMKHRGRIGPAAIVGTGAYVIPSAEGDLDGVSVATVTSGTGEHMATTVAAKTCSDRVYSGQRSIYGGKVEDCGDDEAIHGFIKQDFMNHPSVKHSHSTGAIGMLTLKKSNHGIYLYYGHNTDSFALASMHSDESKPICTMSRSKGNGVIAQGGRAIRYLGSRRGKTGQADPYRCTARGDIRICFASLCTYGKTPLELPRWVLCLWFPVVAPNSFGSHSYCSSQNIAIVPVMVKMHCTMAHTLREVQRKATLAFTPAFRCLLRHAPAKAEASVLLDKIPALGREVGMPRSALMCKDVDRNSSLPSLGGWRNSPNAPLPEHLIQYCMGWSRCEDILPTSSLFPLFSFGLAMLVVKLLQAALLLSISVAAFARGGTPESLISRDENDGLQDIVTWDEIKSLGYSGVSFYTDWALLEGKPGNFSAEGIFDFEPFFDAAKTAGIYLLARPGPYVNAEVSGGGFPGWLQRNPATLRTREPGYLQATDNYAAKIGAIIAKAQITNGGPVILVQPENEYTVAIDSYTLFPDADYFAYVKKQLRDAGIVVPFISNDASPKGYFAPGPPRQPAAVDIYGYDGYPLGFDCANPTVWPSGALPTNYGTLHENQSSSTPNSIIEFQGGAFDPWGGLGFAQCTELLNAQFERVFYKNDFSFGVTILNIYMTYGGTNWGNLGHPGGYTSYDYGAVITEDRLVEREKYSEAKLQANFLQASPAYLTAVYQGQIPVDGSFTHNNDLATTALYGEKTKFFVVRHAAYQSLDTTTYTITLPTSQGNITVPQLGGSLSLHGRDSKFHVTDYDVGGVNLLYSTAEIFTWKRYGRQRVLVVYGGPDEVHELAVSNAGDAQVVEGTNVQLESKQGATVVHFTTSSTRRIVALGCGLHIYILDRNAAYDYWVLSLPSDSTTGNYTNPALEISAPIIKAGYLLRTVEVRGSTISLTGDLNATAPLEIIGGAPRLLRKLLFNGESVPFHQDQRSGVVSATLTYKNATFSLPNLSSLTWKAIDSLPEIQPTYSDKLWTPATLPYSNNTARNLTTPTSLYASDYGYHTGNLLYRGHFTATGNETSLYLSTSGGSAFGHSVWLNATFVGSFYGGDKYLTYNETYPLPASQKPLKRGQHYVLTVLIDNMGLDEMYDVGGSTMKNPRGILDYSLSGRDKNAVSWKLTGNLGGEDYRDQTRGPLNEGGLFAERQGYHLPGAPTDDWETVVGGPMSGLTQSGVRFYAASFELDMPAGYDIPLSFSFANSTTAAVASSNGTTVGTGVPSYRAQIYVNGYQFGKYVHNIGPQGVFPVPEGIWNYHGKNYVAVSLWSLETTGVKVENLSLIAGPVIQSGYGQIELSPITTWGQRGGAY
nr:putative beta-galactosidase a [Quercus suber]